MSRTFEIYDHGQIHLIVVDTDKKLTVGGLIVKYGEKIGLKGDLMIDLMELNGDQYSRDECLPNNTPIENIKSNKLSVICCSDW
jgi:hypothetical protein